MAYTDALKLNRRKNRTLFGRVYLHMHRYWQLHVLALPTVVLLLLFSYAPMFGTVMAFENYHAAKGFLHSEWVGLKNFEFLFSTTDAWRITRNTVLYNVTFLLVNTSLSILLAIIFNELYMKRLAKTLQTMLIMPHFLSMAVIAIIAYAFLNARDGLLNRVIAAVGGKTRNWYMYKPIWPALLVLINAWRGVGYNGIVYVASISGISQEYYEAAVLDGASKLQQAWYITLPYLRRIIVIMLILNLGSIFRGDFGLFYNVPMNMGVLYEYTDVIDTYIYRALTNLGNTGMSAAASLYQSVVGCVMVLLANMVVRRIDEESALF
ncbi:MAG: ABC transporter permease subunit [Eubacteriales bacterium]|nr:ABC transporter permease subunit [Eubacteriales bacterium]